MNDPRPVYWTCAKCDQIGVVHPLPHEGVTEVLKMIEGDHQDANDGARGCALDLTRLKVSTFPDPRHIQAEQEADEIEKHG